MTGRLCMAGRGALYGGRWHVPCAEIATQIVGTERPEFTLYLCDRHFTVIYEAGLITDPYVGDADDFENKYGHRPE